MARGNRGFADGLAGGTPLPAAGTRLPPRTGILAARDNRLAELATGTIVTRVHELVDPAQCRIWDGHNRLYKALNETNCADLIESFKAQGRQEVPAIVRRVHDDPAYAYEVICGARRHWTVTWMRAHHYPDFRFLIEPRELSDEEAFRVADLENRSRRDLSDFERAHDYGRAVERYYGGNQKQMAERLEVSPSWLSRYLDLARLPTEVAVAFASPHQIGISHAAALAPLLRTERQREPLLREAHRLAEEQDALAHEGRPALAPAAVVRRLVQAARSADMPRRRPAPAPTTHVVRNAEGAILASGGRTGRRGDITITLPAAGKHARERLLHAVEEILAQVGDAAR